MQAILHGTDIYI